MGILDDMVKAIRLLRRHDAVPGHIEIPRSQYERLKAECRFTSNHSASSLLGIKIIVKEE